MQKQVTLTVDDIRRMDSYQQSSIQCKVRNTVNGLSLTERRCSTYSMELTPNGGKYRLKWYVNSPKVICVIDVEHDEEIEFVVDAQDPSKSYKLFTLKRS